MRYALDHHDRFLVPNRLVEIDPGHVRRVARPRVSQNLHWHPATWPGDWDLSGPPTDGVGYHQFAFHDDLRAVAAGGTWESTETYRLAMAQLERGESWITGITCREELVAWCGTWDRLLASIAANGYLPQTRIAKEDRSVCAPLNSDEVAVAVGRDGALLVWGGRHRVACATVLGIERIPARVAFRHPYWVNVRHRIAAHAHGHGGVVPQPLLHPDLDNAPCARNWALIHQVLRGALPSTDVRVVDLFPSWGYLCQQFEEDGIACLAVIDGSEDEWFLRTLRTADRRTFELVSTNELATRQPLEVALAVGWSASGDSQGRLDLLLQRVKAARPAEVIVDIPPDASGEADSSDRSRELLELIAERAGMPSGGAVAFTALPCRLFRISRA